MGGKVYVVNQPELVQAVYRNNKALSFAKLAAEVVSRLSMASKETTRILLHNVTAEEVDVGYTVEVLVLGPFPGLFSPSARQGRARVRETFEVYFKTGHQAYGSDLVQSRHAVAVRNGVAL
ncbi:MAG: hypothetical protein Q9179_006049 [Wetmoreana sp. 5 TL-2023]